MSVATTAKDVLCLLKRLNDIDTKLLFASGKVLNALTTQVQAIRVRLPSSILLHHDRLRARGRNSVAPVKEWICTSCYLEVNAVNRNDILKCNALSICEHCGVFVFAIPEGELTDVRLTAGRALAAAKTDGAPQAVLSPPRPLGSRRMPLSTSGGMHVPAPAPQQAASYKSRGTLTKA